MNATVMLRRTMCRPWILLLALLAGGIIATTLDAKSAQSTFVSSHEYRFEKWEPGHTYHVQFTRFKRYGPLKEEIEASPEVLLGPETAINEAAIKIDAEGQILQVTQTIASLSGEKWYTYSSSDADRFLITDHRFGRQVDGPYLPPQVWHEEQDDRENLHELLLALGWQYLQEGFFNGRSTVVYGVMETVETRQTSPSPGRYELPVTYDLNPTSFRYEAQVDSREGVLLQYSRFVSDAIGNETLVESFELQTVHQEE